MLVKLTSRCSMGCSHCCEDATVDGQHMTQATFQQTLRFIEMAEGAAWASGCPPFILLSGGEPAEHPEIVSLLEQVADTGLFPVLISNGMWLGNATLRDAILAPGRLIMVQVVNDRRFYPRVPPRHVDNRVRYFHEIPHITRLGRARHLPALSPRRAPTSYNLRSATRNFRSFARALVWLRMRGFNCTPSISASGEVVAGESRFCRAIGTVFSTEVEITQRLLDMGSCNRCWLEVNLTPVQRRAIGL